MELKIKKEVNVQAKTLKIHMKVCDEFSCELVDQDGQTIAEQEGDYVPSFMPDKHYGDYLILDIDVITGQITNWDKDKVEEYLPEWVNQRQGQEE